MQCVTAVDGNWLAELGPMFYSVKDATTSRGVRCCSLTNSFSDDIIKMLTSFNDWVLLLG